MRTVWSVVLVAVFLFFIALIGRLVIDWVRVLSRQWRPTGVVLVLAELVYTVTDPPLKLVRRIVPSITIGGMRIDLAFLVLMLLTSIVMNIRIA